MDQLIRAFLAIELSRALKNEAQDFIDHVKPEFPQFRFIPEENWHLTLHFFGKINPREVQKIKETLPLFLKNQEAFSVGFEKFGAFPNERKPEILWFGISNQAQVIELKKKLDSCLEELKFETEKREFYPHITVARLKSGVKSQNLGTFKLFKSQTIDQIKQLTLFQSELTSSGAIYTVLHTFPFSTP